MSDIATVAIGDGTLTVEREGEIFDGHTQYAYRITTPEWEYVGNDLHTGVGMDHGPGAMVGTLCAFLSAAAEAYEYGPDSENCDLFPPHVSEWAYMNEDELAIASMADELSVVADLEEGE